MPKGIYPRAKVSEDKLSEIKRLHWQEELTLKEIAEKYGCTSQNIRYLMLSNSIPARNYSEAAILRNRKHPQPIGERKSWHHKWTKEIAEMLRKLYWDDMLSINEIADKLSVSFSTITKVFDRYKIPYRSSEEVYRLTALRHPELNAGKNNGNWQGGISYEPYPFDFWKSKQSIKERDGYTCQECGITEAESIAAGEQTLTVHHIDYDKQNTSYNNLIMLCRHCNSIANFNKNYWKKYFRRKMCLLLTNGGSQLTLPFLNTKFKRLLKPVAI